jgi:hypothetical protein
MSGNRLWNPAERPDMSGLELWNPDKAEKPDISGLGVGYVRVRSLEPGYRAR